MNINNLKNLRLKNRLDIITFMYITISPSHAKPDLHFLGLEILIPFIKLLIISFKNYILFYILGALDFINI